jgi:nitroreductase
MTTERADTTVFDAIRTKRDTRRYSDRPIPEAALRRILQAGRMAGSSKNTQPVRFVIVRDQAHKEELAACGDFSAHLPSAPVAVAVVLLPDGGAFDAGRAAQNMMVAAWAEGITSCPTSMHRPECAAAVLRLPPDHRVQVVLPFAYPAEEAEPDARRPRPRLPLADYVHEEYWGEPGAPST